MGQIEQKYLDVLEKHDWAVCGYTDDGRVELEKFSPAGEDFIICVGGRKLSGRDQRVCRRLRH